MAALLAAEQHHPLFQCVQHLKLEGKLPKELPEVSEQPHVMYDTVRILSTSTALLAGVVDSESLVLPSQLLHRMYLRLCRSSSTWCTACKS
jgi:hypothetical protein